MSPAEGRRRMNAAERCGLRQALAFDHRSGVIEPALLLAQMRHRRFGQRVEGAPAALAAKPQKAVRAAPADDLAARAMRTALGLDALIAGRSKRVLAGAAPDAFLRTTPRQTRRLRIPSFPFAASSACNASRRCTALNPAIAKSHPEKSSAFIESIPTIRPSLTQINS
jgi:hypothetical protein